MQAPRNFVPGRYRGVSVTRVGGSLDEASVRALLVGRRAYFKTRFVVARSDRRTALLRVVKAEGGGLFSEIKDVEMLASPEETAYVEAPEVDTGIPSELARIARESAADRRAVVVHGRYEHVNFIIGADPLRIRVREVVPPYPPKLLDQALRILAVREDLPPIELVPDLVQLADVARANPATDYLLPCRGSGFAIDGAGVHFLDQHPHQVPWTMLGCTRSQQIHNEFYGDDPLRISICPLERTEPDGPTLAKCCLQDDEIAIEKEVVSVPWGSSMERVSQALDALVRMKEPTWQPA